MSFERITNKVPAAKNKSYVFVAMNSNILRDLKIVLAPDDKTCIEKILNRYSSFDSMMEYLLIEGEFGGPKIKEEEKIEANQNTQTREEFLKKHQSQFFSWFPCYSEDVIGTGWDYKIVDKLI
jgi:hypothetical protein